MRARIGHYLLLQTIGSGAFANVRYGIHEVTGRHYAVKVMDKAHIRNHELTLNVRREIAIMKALNHPNIVALHQVLSSNTKLYIVLDLVQGRELFEIISSQGTTGLPEQQARAYFQQLIDAVAYCHSRGVCHRDLKPENLLVDQIGKLKVTDFGFSSMKGANTASDLLSTQCGTPHYIAPEIISNSNPSYDGQKVDAWACGIILYALLVGYLPFDETDLTHLFRVIQRAYVEYPSWVSLSARHLISRLLCVDPQARLSVHQVKRHPWFLVDYHPSTNSNFSSQPSPRRRRPRMTSNVDHTTGFFNPLVVPSHPHTSRKTDPLPAHAPPQLQLPQLELPLASADTPWDAAQSSARAVTMARNEMIKSGRPMTSARKYSLLRKGVVNYGRLEIGVASFSGPSTLGGEEQARIRGVLSSSTFGSVLGALSTTAHYSSSSIASGDGVSAPIVSGVDEQPGHQQRTRVLEQSLQKPIPVSNTTLPPDEEEQSDVQQEYGAKRSELVDSTLSALRRLRMGLQKDALQPLGVQESSDAGNQPSASAVLTLQSGEMIKLLDVWETRIISDTASTVSDGTALSEEEVRAFQSLLGKWETFLSGQNVVEDVTIPGSERVEDEVPTQSVPERFKEEHRILCNMDYRLRDAEQSAVSLLTKSSRHSRWSLDTPGSKRSVKWRLPDSHGRKSWDCRMESTKQKSARQSDDLTDKWNQVLVANTSDLGSRTLKVDDDSVLSTRGTRSLAIEFESSPVTDFRPSGDRKHVEVLELSTSQVSEAGTHGIPSIANSRHSTCDCGSPQQSKIRHVSNLRNNYRQSVDNGALSRDTKPPRHRVLSVNVDAERDQYKKSRQLYRSGGQRRIKTEGISEAININSHAYEPTIRSSVDKFFRRSSRRSSKPERRLGGGWQIRTRNRIFSKLRNLQFRSKFEGRFECAIGPEDCLVKMQKLLDEMGVDVRKKRALLMLQVDLLHPSGDVAVAGIFDFQGRHDREGCAVHFKKKDRERVVSRGKEAFVLSEFFDQALDWFSSKHPNVLLYPEG